MKNAKKWLKKYQRKIRKRKTIGLSLLIFALISLICQMSYIVNMPYGSSPTPIIIFFLCWIISMPVGMVLLFLNKIAWRKYNGNYIIYYYGLTKGYLIINDEVQCTGEMFQHDYYGQLPDGTDVYAHISAWTGSVKFSIGSTNNHNISFF